MHRRKFLKASAVLSAGAVGAYALPLLTAFKSNAAGAKTASAQCRWGMVIDLTRCPPNCTACVDACKKENNVNTSGDSSRDIYRIRKVTLESTLTAAPVQKAVPLLCNHCDNPPCALACPIKATYKREDGIVIVDPHRCMGCRYCMIACPYNARHFNFRENPNSSNPAYPKREHGVAESCDLCSHLLDQGKRPACVEACASVQANALMVGNLNDPNSEIAAIIRKYPIKRLREELGTEPKVFYIGL
jgi:tetrathionate reductase subunit B